MISMIIADDELVIRQGLMSIPWPDYGIKLLGAASNGNEALAMAREMQPQILLTDIKMPGLDGLKLIDAIKKEVPGVKAILLTGYQDFEYAHTAIQLGAMGYILKPSDPDEIIEIVLKAKKEVVEDLEEKMEKRRMLQKVDSSRQAVLHSMLLDLIFGRIHEAEEIMEKCGELGYELGAFSIMLISLEKEKEELDADIIGKIREEINGKTSIGLEGTVIDIHPASFCIIAEAREDGKSLKEDLLSHASEIEGSLRGKYGVKVSVGISGCLKGAASLHQAFNQASNCIRLGKPYVKCGIIHVDDLNNSLQNNKVISDIMSYMEKYYMDDISLMSVSEHVHMNHIYISRLIKKETGETFLDILTKIRMKKACQLLANPDYKSYEISYMVGIKDAGYFSQVFKKYCGMTPKEYRENLFSACKINSEETT